MAALSNERASKKKESLMKTSPIVESRFDRIFLHLTCCIRRPSHWRWHWQGIQRELPSALCLRPWRAGLQTAMVLCSLLLAWIASAQDKPEKNQEVHPTRLLARQARGIQPQAAARFLETHGAVIRKHVATVPRLVILDAGRDAHTKMKALRASGLFEYVEPDYRVHVNLAPTDAAFADGRLWALRNTGQNGGVPGADIGVVPAWDITTGSTNVTVAVIDTGIRYTHQDLASQMWRNPGEIPGNGIDDDQDGFVDNIFGINAITNSGDPLDDNNHGTHVAGTIGAASNNGSPHVGVAWRVRLMACKFLDASGSGYTSDAIDCINFAVNKGAKILNNSWGGGGYSQALHDAIAAARDAGVLFVAAAGNSARDTDAFPNFPSCYDLENVISVAALDRSDNLASFSNYGRASVDLAAPGASIFSSTAGTDSDYNNFDGTSMAAPHVSGVAALVVARFPGITLAELRQRLLATTVPVSALTARCVSGGRLNAYSALSASADGSLEVATSTSIAPPLTARAHVGLFVVVSDLFPVTDATVTGQVMGGDRLTFSNDGRIPDATGGDNIYSATLPVPANATNVTVQLMISAPGKISATTLVSFAIRFPPPLPSVTPGVVEAIACQDDGKIIIGGFFSTVNGVTRNNIARLNSDGSLDQTWNPGADNAVRQIAVSGTDVFVRGDFYMIGGQRRRGLAKLSATGSGAADPLWNPNVPGNLHAIAISGTDLFVGGLSYLAKFSTTDSGLKDSVWGMQPDYSVYVLAVRGTNLYVGGDFRRLGGESIRSLAKVSTLGAGNVDSAWDPMVRGAFGSPVRALAFWGDDLLLGGSFNSVGGMPRTNLAKVSATGIATVDVHWNPEPLGPLTGSSSEGVEAGHIYGLAMAGPNLYVSGIFCSVGGLSRTNLAKVSATGSGSADPSWQADTEGQWVSALAVSNDSVIAGGTFTRVNGQLCSSLAKLDPLTGNPDNSFSAQVGFGLPPSWLQLSVTNGLTLFGMPGAMYQIEFTKDLSPPVTWLPLTTLAPSGESVAVPGTRPAADSRGFYRALLVFMP